MFEHRVIAHFDLARFRNDRGEKNAAFGHWRAGHALVGRIQPFSRQANAAFFDATISTYDARRLREGPAAANTDAAPLFIVGLPRSGTSLTEQIIAAHELVHGGGERAALHRSFTRLTNGGAIDAAAFSTGGTTDGTLILTDAGNQIVTITASTNTTGSRLQNAARQLPSCANELPWQLLSNVSIRRPSPMVNQTVTPVPARLDRE